MGAKRVHDPDEGRIGLIEPDTEEFDLEPVAKIAPVNADAAAVGSEERTTSVLIPLIGGSSGPFKGRGLFAELPPVGPSSLCPCSPLCLCWGRCGLAPKTH
jgi:hypothetical protein